MNSATAHTNTSAARRAPLHDRDLIEHSPWWVVVLPLPQFVVAVPDPVRFAIANPSALRGSAAGAVVIPGVVWSRDSTGTAYDTVAADTPL